MTVPANLYGQIHWHIFVHNTLWITQRLLSIPSNFGHFKKKYN